MKQEWYKGYLLTIDGDGPVFEYEDNQETIVWANETSAKLRIDSVEAIQDHPWLSGDLRELARLIRGGNLPHLAKRCEVCREWLKAVAIPGTRDSVFSPSSLRSAPSDSS